MAPYDPARQAWIQKWTLFYWAWWIAWSPFVGVFIARISRGRSIREFLACVILIPAIFSCLWFATFGTMSTSVELEGYAISALPSESVLFATLSHFPLGPVLSIVALLLIVSFFVTSADSATFVLGMISEDGSFTPRRRTRPPRRLL
ncbi:MAG: BCCT family transporter [Coriobacteriales bacterium]|nr:BCCT family transporter [Coriobacteriales bacterium]